MGKKSSQISSLRERLHLTAAILIDEVGDGGHFDMNEKLGYVETHLASLASLLPLLMLCLFLTHIQEALSGL